MLRTLQRSLSSALALIVLAAMSCGCGSGGGGSPALTKPSTGTLRISVTDAPFPSSYVLSASVVINEVQVHQKGSEAWQTVFVGAAEIDLVPLVGGVTETLVAAELPPGIYDQVRLIVEAGDVLLSDDAVVEGDLHTFSTEDGNLFYPSGAQTGIKLKIDNDIVVATALSSDLVLDFDLTKSFVFNGPPTHEPGVKRVLFKPVVRATNASTAGTLALDVLSDNATPEDAADDPPLEGATVRVLDDTGMEVAAILTDAMGHAEVSLAPGIYDVVVEAAGHDAADIQDAEVVLANLTDLGDVTLVATEVEITGTVMSDLGTPADATDDPVLEAVQVDLHVAGDAAVLATAMTDAQGVFRFDGLAPGSYDLSLSKAGYVPQDVAGVTGSVPGTGTPLQITLAALFRDIAGVVTDAGGATVSDLPVTITGTLGQVLGGAITDPNGAYSIPGIPSGEHTLEAGGVSRSLVVVGTDPTTPQTEDVQLP